MQGTADIPLDAEAVPLISTGDDDKLSPIRLAAQKSRQLQIARLPEEQVRVRSIKALSLPRSACGLGRPNVVHASLSEPSILVLHPPINRLPCPTCSCRLGRTVLRSKAGKPAPFCRPAGTWMHPTCSQGGCVLSQPHTGDTSMNKIAAALILSGGLLLIGQTLRQIGQRPHLAVHNRTIAYRGADHPIASRPQRGQKCSQSRRLHLEPFSRSDIGRCRSRRLQCDPLLVPALLESKHGWCYPARAQVSLVENQTLHVRPLGGISSCPLKPQPLSRQALPSGCICFQNWTPLSRSVALGMESEVFLAARAQTSPTWSTRIRAPDSRLSSAVRVPPGVPGRGRGRLACDAPDTVRRAFSTPASSWSRRFMTSAE